MRLEDMVQGLNKLIKSHNNLIEESNNLIQRIDYLEKKLNKLEWIIAILVSILFAIGYCLLLQLCIRWLL